MNDYLSLAIIVLWLVYGIIIKLTRKRKYDYSFIIAFVFLLGWIYFNGTIFEHGMLSNYYTYFIYTIFGVFSIWMIVDNSLLLFKKNVSELDFNNLEKDLEELSTSSELLRQRFISTIELIQDGLVFRDGDLLFGTDRFLELTGVKSNEFTYDYYREIIHKDDLVQYDMVLSKLTKKYPTYTIKYRVKKEGKYVWISESGKLLLLSKKKSYISTIKSMDIRMYPQTDVDVLNNMENYKEMYQEMQRLNRKRIPYHFILIQLTNIPKINEKYGRDFGDLLMGEYLSKLRFKFIKDHQSLYRISGIKFGLLIKDKSKFELLDRALVGTGELLTLQMQFGGVSQTIYPNLGISESPYGGKNPDIVIQEASDALDLSCSDDFETSFCFAYKKSSKN